MLVFCKENFKKNAKSNVKRSIPSEHLDVLDGMDVNFHESDFGIIPLYKIDGDETDWLLYPIPKEWCREKQLEFEFQENENVECTD